MRTKSVLSVILLFTSLLAFPQPKSEIRAVWLSTISGLDWPRKVSDPQEQKEKFCELLDSLQAININTVIFQAQSQGDVLWESDIQPASYDITKDGSKRLPYNVCEFVIEECHKRNMECHADIVPFRLGSTATIKRYQANPVKHVYVTHPEYCDPQSPNGVWLDPGIPEARQYLLELYTELLTRNKFDGINFDYTRYPEYEGINDSESYRKYGNGMSLDDWRRNNINTLVHDVYDMAKSIDPYIKVGSAPIGTYKNLPNKHNMAAYDDCWQDPCEWMQAGKHDLVVPQLYWDEDYGFTPHMNMWLDNIDGRQFVAGLAAYKTVYPSDVIPSQITKVRNTPGTAGVSFFRTQFLTNPENPKVVLLYNKLKDEYFKYPAHIVPMDFNGVTKPNKPVNPSVEYKDGTYTFKWSAPEPDSKNTPIRYYCIYASESPSVDIADVKNCVGFFIKGNEFTYSSANANLNFVITAFDKNYYESDGAVIGTSGIADNLTDSIAFSYNGGEINITSGNGINMVSVYSVSGVTVKHDRVNAKEATIYCGDLPEGIYIVKAAYENGTVSSHKIKK